MQILGIWLENGDPRVIKNLKPNTWYPFGNLNTNYHDYFINKKKVSKNNENEEILIEEINRKQKFTNTLYKETTNKKPEININCIVGKNGSGKSSLLNIEYRIINNFACKISQCLPNYNQSYSPIWATGFNAELYYELNSKIYYLKVQNNEKLEEKNYKNKKKRIELNFDNDATLKKLFLQLEKKGKKKSSNSNPETEKLQKDLLDEISKHFFYTISSNYSVYSNAIVNDKWDNIKETWQHRLYHKNDGYLTPIVLVPYKESGATIDTEKELELSEERVSTLALLNFVKNEDAFIENLNPSELKYKLQNNESYSKTIYEKYFKTFNITRKTDKNRIIDFHTKITDSWAKMITSKFEKNWKSLGKIGNIENILIGREIQKNILDYLSFKTVKMSFNYNLYNKDIDKDKLLKAIKSTETQIVYDIEKVINKIINNEYSIDFTNLKVFQCLKFINNASFYLCSRYLNYNSATKIYTIPAEQIKNHILSEKQKDDCELDFDYVFMNLLPPFFIKDLLFTKNEGENKEPITIATLSSGESQLLNCISYSIYHMKNASSTQKEKTRIHYRNMNLIFDEAELYYHPEYQRRFISDLLKIINRSNLINIDSINISIVTHSPFMLSDIPAENILLLKNGTKTDEISKTLGANFYDLLKKQFFMDSSIGSNTEKIINDILLDYNKLLADEKFIPNNEKNKIKNKYLENSDEYNFYNQFSEKLADTYLKDTITNLIDIIKNYEIGQKNEKN